MIATFDVQGSRFNEVPSAMAFAVCAPPAPRPRSRRGVSLMEVLISTFVLSVGLLGVAALIPVGQIALLETSKSDRAGACGRAALRQVRVGRLLDPQIWHPAPAPQGQLPPFAIDPLGVTRGLGGMLGPIPRISIAGMTATRAQHFFVWQDDKIFEIPPDRNVRPFVPSNINMPFEGLYSWLVTVTPAASEAPAPIAEKTHFLVSVVVCYRRNFSREQAVRVQQFFGAGVGQKAIGGGAVRLSGPLENARENHWVLITDGQRQCHWYRVIASGDNPATSLTLAGPDYVPTGNDTLVLIEQVVGVYTTSVELDRDLLWLR
jgi:hypothetical protein